jgi:hypothetical protein
VRDPRRQFVEFPGPFHHVDLARPGDLSLNVAVCARASNRFAAELGVIWSTTVPWPVGRTISEPISVCARVRCAVAVTVPGLGREIAGELCGLRVEVSSSEGSAVG